MISRYYYSIIILILCLPQSVNAQKEANIWYFGDHAGIDFNHNPPIALTNSAMYQLEGCAVISDFNGNLLFYTDGMTVWNRNHMVMKNGNNLMGEPSSTQSAIIVPFPANNNKYYIFTVGAEISYEKGLRYSVVDMNLDNGLGAVTEEKNIFLLSPMEEKVTAIRHQNGRDIWVITHSWDSDAFFSYLVTEVGISENPVISHVGTFHTGANGNTHGNIKVSPNGKKLAIIVRQINTFELFDFNDNTGVVSNPITFNPFDGLLYYIEFSPDNSKLYISRYLSGSDIFQFDLSSDNPDEIIHSKVKIGSVSNLHLGALQLAPDKKIYVSKHSNLVGDLYLGVINYPNVKGVGSNFIENGFYLAGKKCIWGLPNFIENYFLIDFYAEPLCFGDTTLFMPTNQDVDSVFWDFGDPVTGDNNYSHEFFPGHVFSSPGSFDVTLTRWKNGVSSSIVQPIFIYNMPDVFLGNDTTICLGEELLLTPGGGFTTYLWQDGSIDSVYRVDTSGIYWVKVQNVCGIATDTIEITFGDTFYIDLGPDTTFCTGNQLPLSPGGQYSSYLWQDGSMDSVYFASDSGVYWVRVTDSAGCTATDTINIETFPAFQFELGSDTTICYGDYIFLIGPEGYQSYLWQDGSTYNTYIAGATGIYWLEVGDTNNCTARDSLLLTVRKIPDDILGNDTVLCKGGSMELSTHPLFYSYYWQDGSTGTTFTVTRPGKYWVSVLDSMGCTGSDTIVLDYFLDLTLRLEAQGYLCEDDSVLLVAQSNFTEFLWQDGSTDSLFVARDSGTYWVRVGNPCEAKADTIVIDACSSLWVPNVFTPNNDGYNDYFYAVGTNVPKFKMEIFNRWGRVLKILTSIDQKWDGTYHGKPCAEGTYFWVADYEMVNRNGTTQHIQLQGSVTLLR